MVMWVCLYLVCCVLCFFCFFKQKTAYEMRISDWSSGVCSSDLQPPHRIGRRGLGYVPEDRRVFARLSVQENLECGRQPPRAGTRTWSDNDLLEIGRASCRERVCQYV